MNGLKPLTRVAGIVIVASTLTAGLVQAAPAESVVAGSVAVGYADLDLGNVQGVRALYERILDAADRSCGRYDARDLRAMRDWRNCYAAAVTAAVAGVDNDSLNALHARGGELAGERLAAANPS